MSNTAEKVDMVRGEVKELRDARDELVQSDQETARGMKVTPGTTNDQREYRQRKRLSIREDAEARFLGDGGNPREFEASWEVLYEDILRERAIQHVIDGIVDGSRRGGVTL